SAAVAPVSRGLAKPKSSHEVRLPQALTKAVESLPSAKSPSWESLASEGQYEKAYQLAYGSAVVVGKGGHAAEPELLSRPGATPGQLLLLADVARLSHHATEAVPPLQKLLLAHASDPRAPLAAFTLGRVLLDELGRPREAAESFQHAQQLDPTGPLAQDALARECATLENWPISRKPAVRLFAGIWTQGVSAQLATLRSLGWLGACLLAGLSNWAVPGAQAHEHPPVALRVDACVPVHVQQVRQLLALELQSELVDEPSGPEVARAFVSCPASVSSGEGLASKEAGADELAGQQTDLRVDDPVTGRSLVRSVDLQHADPE
ncbi:hypothetical protein DAPPUDRAFT_125457, partial [Daphnia pulex]